MHECIVHLLKSSSDEQSLECFATVITTIGKDLDIPEAKVREGVVYVCVCVCACVCVCVCVCVWM